MATTNKLASILPDVQQSISEGSQLHKNGCIHPFCASILLGLRRTARVAQPSGVGIRQDDGLELELLK